MTAINYPLLALDPSSTKIGWALFGPGPTYITSNVWMMPAAPADERVVMVHNAVHAIITQCCPIRPATALIEMPDYLADYATQKIVLYFRSVGVAECAAYLCGLPIRYVKASKYRETTRKQDAKDRFVSGVGRYPNSDDESDAFCIGWDYIVEQEQQGT